MTQTDRRQSGKAQQERNLSADADGSTDMFTRSDAFLRREVSRIRQQREALGLDRLAGNLRCAVINTEPENLRPAVSGFLTRTGFTIADAFEDARAKTVVLSAADSADILLRCRSGSGNPFAAVPGGPKSNRLPNTRLETFFFETPDLEEYLRVQRDRGLIFLDSETVHCRNYRAGQTAPSPYTGLSTGFMEGHLSDGYRTDDAVDLRLDLDVSPAPWLKHIGPLDHTATRVRAEDRDAAIVEFMELTGYDFTFAIYVESLNSITTVARMQGQNFAMVFTSGITPDAGGDDAGPTEMFIRNYGTRVHHLALRTEKIESTYAALVQDGQEFMIELVGSPQEGLRQTFSAPSPHTMLVIELIERYGDFSGFFTRSNVTALTGATTGQ